MQCSEAEENSVGRLAAQLAAWSAATSTMTAYTQATEVARSLDLLRSAGTTGGAGDRELQWQTPLSVGRLSRFGPCEQQVRTAWPEVAKPRQQPQQHR